MAKKLKFFRGPKESMPQLEVGEPGFTTDEKRLYVGDGTENVGIAKQEDIADIVTTTGGGSVTMPGGYEGPVEIIFTEETDEGGTLYVAISGTDGSYTSDSGAKAIYEAFTGGSAVFATIGENIVPLTHVSLSGSTYSAQFNVLSGIEGYQSILLTQSDTTQHVYVLENKPTAEDVTYDNGTSGLAATDV